MKIPHNASRAVIAALLVAGALGGAGSAFAQYAPPHMPPRVYAQPQVIPVGLHIAIGWHGDRYWDGHRYWRHDEWMHRHPHDRDPYRDDGHRPASASVLNHRQFIARRRPRALCRDRRLRHAGV